MTTEAQINANRLNAQKSTGPRTPEGKAVSALNALKHGLLTREGFIRGEDEIDYQIHREYLWGYLLPGSPLEEILANQIIDRTWRLKRCAQDQAEAFASLFDKTLAGAPEPEEEAERGKIIGRMLVEDFSGKSILERLQRYERRIEGGFYRALHEMRRVFDQRQKVAREADEEFRENLAREKEDKWEAYKRKMFARTQAAVLADRPVDTTTNWAPDWRPAGPEISRQTNPIKEGVGAQGPGVSDLTPELLRQTKPIWHDPEEQRVPADGGITNDPAQNRPTET